jgi:hypothetical protein
MMRALLLWAMVALAFGCAGQSQTGVYGVTPVYLRVKLGPPRQVIEQDGETGLVYVSRGKTSTFWFVGNRLVRTERQGKISAETKRLIEEFEALAKELQADAKLKQ